MPSAPLTPPQRRRLRRVLRAGLVGVVALEVLVLSFGVLIPSVRAGVPVIDLQVGIWTGMIYSALGGTNSRIDTANGHLAQIETDTRRIRELADQNAQPLGDNWSADLAAVTKTPTEKLQGISFQDPGPGAALRTLIPGAVPWTDYYAEYSASADTVLSTLRSSLDATHAHNLQIEDATALERIANLASSTDSRLAMGELKVQSNLEVARQLHALRAQQALETSLYAITASHEIGTDARRIAEDREAGCRRMAALVSGVFDAYTSTLIC